MVADALYPFFFTNSYQSVLYIDCNPWIYWDFLMFFLIKCPLWIGHRVKIFWPSRLPAKLIWSCFYQSFFRIEDSSYILQPTPNHWFPKKIHWFLTSKNLVRFQKAMVLCRIFWKCFKWEHCFKWHLHFKGLWNILKYITVSHSHKWLRIVENYNFFQNSSL